VLAVMEVRLVPRSIPRKMVSGMAFMGWG